MGIILSLNKRGTFYSCNYFYHTNKIFSNDYDGKCVPEKCCVLRKPSDLDDYLITE